MAHSNLHGGFAIVAVELAYVSLTAGLYAGCSSGLWRSVRGYSAI
jgi:hypothetical protein